MKARLRGGMTPQIDRTTLLTLLFLLLVVHAILAILMWTDQIQFASYDAHLGVSITITIAGSLILLYLIFILTSNSDKSDTSEYLLNLIAKVDALSKPETQ